MSAPWTLAWLLLCAAPARAVDLAKTYPATLDFFEGQPTREWTSTKDDVWALESFRFEYQGKLEIECGPSNVVFGVHDGNVVWAALFATEGGKIATALPGGGKEVASIWMRFNPAHLRELFPPATVVGRGPAELVASGARLCRAKIRGGWQANDLPVIPKKGSFVLDVQTRDGERHDYVVDKGLGTVDRCAACAWNGLAPTVLCSRDLALEAFDAAWTAFDEEYAKFGIRPDVDWKALGEKYRRSAEKATTTFDVAATISALLAELRDLHVYVKLGEEFLPGYERPRPSNASWEATKAIVGGLTDTKHDVVWGRTKDGIGYVNVHRLGDSAAPAAFDDVLEQLADTWALVVDLRFNGGGDELEARALAGRFLDQKRVYSKNQYRAGKAHGELGKMLEREVEPRGPWRYESPVAVLQGQRVMSSAESFALMLAQCPQVTTIGDRTAGASANPRRLELAGGIVVNLPRWIDHDADGKSIEDVGIAPDVVVAAKPEAFTAKSDPVLEKALEILRKTPKKDRMPGRRAAR